MRFKKGVITLPETNIASENGWLEYDQFLMFPFGMAYFQGLLLLVSGRLTTAVPPKRIWANPCWPPWVRRLWGCTSNKVEKQRTAEAWTSKTPLCALRKALSTAPLHAAHVMPSTDSSIRRVGGTDATGSAVVTFKMPQRMTRMAGTYATDSQIIEGDIHKHIHAV